jgi:hypothetical protein
MKKFFIFFLVLCTLAIAQENFENAEYITLKQKDAVVEQPVKEEKAITFSAGADLVTQYWYNGIICENQGLIFQANAALNINLYKGNFLTSLDFNVSTFATFLDSPVADWAHEAGENLRSYYEQDLTLDLAFTFADCFTFDVAYSLFNSPTHSFDTYQQLEFGIEFNEKEFTCLPFAIVPYARLIAELDGANDGRNEGVYLELGIKPNYEIKLSDSYSMTLSLPMACGFSLDNYYDFGVKDDNDFVWGFYSLTARLDVPLSFIPEKFGTWNWHIQATMLVVDSQLMTYNHGWRISNDDNVHVFVGTGIDLSF